MSATNRLVVGALIVLETLTTAAQVVGERELDAARRLRPEVTPRDIDAVRKQLPDPATLQRAPAPSVRVDALPRPASEAKPGDLGAMARGFEGAITESVDASPLKQGPGLIVFVSLSMPEATLKRLVEQAHRARARLVVRGFVDGSFRATVSRMEQLLGGRNSGFQIDPQLFANFGVSAVPTFVVVNPRSKPSCRDGKCQSVAPFASVAGDVSVDYALEYIARHDANVAASARAILARFRGGQP